MTQAVLVIEDEAVLAKNMCIYLERQGYEVRHAASAEEGIDLLDATQPDAIVVDFNLPGCNGLEALERIRRRAPELPVVMITGHGSVELAVDAMKAGACDFLSKPVPLGKLHVVLQKAFGRGRQDGEISYYRKRGQDGAALSLLIGESEPMRDFKRTLQQLLQAEAGLRDSAPPPVLVLGETGTGKELVARALHANGDRRDKPFVELNCAAIPTQLLESELFGHERGAFTDARERKLGLVETADGGTLFLDEIGDMEPALQSKLLKLLEEKTVRRLGGLRDQKVDVRIVAATHRPLESLVRDGRFRADLYFRLCVVQLQLPPLRERGDDVLLLSRHFLAAHAARYGKPAPRLSAAAEGAMSRYTWPGNVRELRNVLERALLLNTTGVIGPGELALSDGIAARAQPIALTAETSLRQLERDALRQALEKTGWNVSRAARLLDISRDTLRYRIEKHGLNADAVAAGVREAVR